MYLAKQFCETLRTLEDDADAREDIYDHYIDTKLITDRNMVNDLTHFRFSDKSIARFNDDHSVTIIAPDDAANYMVGIIIEKLKTDPDIEGSINDMIKTHSPEVSKIIKRLMEKIKCA